MTTHPDTSTPDTSPGIAVVSHGGLAWTLRRLGGVGAGWEVVESADPADRWWPDEHAARRSLERRAAEGALPARGRKPDPGNAKRLCVGCRTLAPSHTLDDARRCPACRATGAPAPTTPEPRRGHDPRLTIDPRPQEAPMPADTTPTAQEAEWIRLHVEKSATPGEIAARTGAAVSTIRRALKRHGVWTPVSAEERGRRGAAATPAREALHARVLPDGRTQGEEWVRLHVEEGLSPDSIAKQFGCSAHPVRQHLTATGTYTPLDPSASGLRGGRATQQRVADLVARSADLPPRIDRDAPLATGAEPFGLVIEPTPRSTAAEDALRAERDAALERAERFRAFLRVYAHHAILARYPDPTDDQLILGLGAAWHEERCRLDAVATALGVEIDTDADDSLESAHRDEIEAAALDRAAALGSTLRGVQAELTADAQITRIAALVDCPPAADVAAEVEALVERSNTRGERLRAWVEWARRQGSPRADDDAVHRTWLDGRHANVTAALDDERERGRALDAKVREAFRRSGLTTEHDVDIVYHGVLLDRLAEAARCNRCTTCDLAEIAELTGLRARVAELEAERDVWRSQVASLASTPCEACEDLRAQIAELERERDAVEERLVSQEAQIRRAAQLTEAVLRAGAGVSSVHDDTPALEIPALMVARIEELGAEGNRLRAQLVVYRRAFDAHEALRGAELLRMEAEVREHEAAAELDAARAALRDLGEVV